MFGDIPNMQVILAVDKNQLVQTISSLYGSNTSIERYLKNLLTLSYHCTLGTLATLSKAFIRSIIVALAVKRYKATKLMTFVVLS